MLAIPFVIIAFLFLGFVLFKYIVDPILNPSLPVVAHTEKEIEQQPEIIIEEVIKEKITMVVIENTPTGWLRVRSGPGTSYEVVTRVYPEDSFPLLGEEEGWYNIQIDEETSGWVSSVYVNKIKNKL